MDLTRRNMHLLMSGAIAGVAAVSGAGRSSAQSGNSASATMDPLGCGAGAKPTERTKYRRAVEARMLLSDFLRHELMLAGTHVGC